MNNTGRASPPPSMGEVAQHVRDHGKLPDDVDPIRILRDAATSLEVFRAQAEALAPCADAIRAGLLQRSVQEWITDEGAPMGFRSPGAPKAGAMKREAISLETLADQVGRVASSEDAMRLAEWHAVASVGHARNNLARFPGADGHGVEEALQALLAIEAASNSVPADVRSAVAHMEGVLQAASAGGRSGMDERDVEDLGKGVRTAVTTLPVPTGEEGAAVTAIGLYQARLNEVAQALEGWASDLSQLPSIRKGQAALEGAVEAAAQTEELGAASAPSITSIQSPSEGGSGLKGVLGALKGKGARGSRRVVTPQAQSTAGPEGRQLGAEPRPTAGTTPPPSRVRGPQGRGKLPPGLGSLS